MILNSSAWARLAPVIAALGLAVGPGSAGAPAPSGITVQPVPDQHARIVTASATGGVSWGNEPVVVTVRVTPADAALSIRVSPPALLTVRLSGVDHHVLTLTPTGAVGVARVAVTAAKGDLTADTSFAVQIDRYADTGRYRWSDMPIPGGGFVTGFVFHPRVPNILYARTDVGGAWRFDIATGRWECISNWVRDDIADSPGQPLGIALDPDPARSGYVYLAYGRNGTIVRSTDHGNTWVRLGDTGGSAAGNVDSRGAGERLVVLPGDGRTMYFAGTTGNTYLVPDNVDPALVYAFGTTTYVSRDGGRTFRQASTAYDEFSTAGLAAVNGSRDIRADLDLTGVIEVGGNGLWRLTYDAASNTMSAASVPVPTTVARYGPGIGVNADPAAKARYVYGTRPGAGQQSGYGVWRSTDQGATWTKISTSTDNPSPAGTPGDPYLNANVQYADVRGVVGDSRVFGRVYVSLGNVSGGLRVGEPVVTLMQSGATERQTAPDRS